jgi:PAS domain S-box-containing protein
MKPKDHMLVQEPAPELSSGETEITTAAKPNEKSQDAHKANQEARIERAEARTEQAEARTDEAKLRTDQAKLRTEQAEVRTEQAETRTEQAKTRTEQAEVRTEQAEARTEQAEARTEAAEARSEQGMQTSQLDYQRLFQAAKDGILILDAETGQISDANPALTEMVGFSHAELLDTPIWELGAFKDVVSNKAKFEQLQAQGYARYENMPLETREGHKITVEFVSNVYCAGDRTVIQCNVRDVTERKQAEETSVRMAAIVNSSEDAIIGKTLAGIITSWNPGAEKVFGYSAAEAVGQPMSMLFPPDRVSEEKEILARIARGENIEHFETVRIGKNGKKIDVSVTLSAIVDSDNKIIGLSKIARDITERKRAEREVLSLNAKLEQRVLERTAQLEAANKELDSFSYSVSHDLRAPLRAIDGFSQAMQEDFGALLPEEGQRYLKTIREGAQRMGVLIDDLLTFSRLSRLPLTRGTVDTNELVRALVAEMAPPGQNGHAKIEVSDLPQSNADPALLKQVWINLLSNALKYTRHRKGARIEIGAEQDNGATTWFVRDNGTGFDMCYIDKLFGVFQRLHRSEDYEGTGVGLAIVQRVVERHGGRVWADAEPDRGATFFFTLGENTEV